MKIKTFIIKVLKLIAIILLLSTLLVLAIKKQALFSNDRVSIHIFRGDIHLRIQMFLFFYFMQVLLTYSQQHNFIYLSINFIKQIVFTKSGKYDYIINFELLHKKSVIIQTENIFKVRTVRTFFIYGAPKGSRTPNLQIRSLTLYPIEL